MSYLFTEEQELMRKAAEEFAVKVGLPALIAQQKAGKERFDFALGLWPRLAEMNFIGIPTPEKLGGLGMDITTELLVLEALAIAGPLSTNIDAHNLGLHTIEYNGSDYQKERWGIPAAKGEIICAAAVTDPAGSMNFPEWTIRAEETDKGYVINGTKVFCTNSDEADVYVVFTTDYENGFPMGAYIVEKGTPGLETGHLEQFGKKGTNTGTIVLKNVEIPKENRMPPGDLATAPWLSLGYLDAAAMFIGLAKFCLDKTTNYVKQRTRNGKPLSSLQSVAHRLADMYMQYEQARTLMYTAAALYDAGKPDYKMHSMAKIATTEALTKIAHDCCVLHGGYGFAPETGLIQIHSSTPATHVGECPNDFHRDLIAKYLGIVLDSHLS
ncbi:MAG: acyl-CoA dehydrogenase family protein [Dehalobacterium sp.]